MDINMEKVNALMLMGLFMMGNGSMVRKRVMESKNLLMVSSMLENGKMI